VKESKILQPLLSSYGLEVEYFYLGSCWRDKNR